MKLLSVMVILIIKTMISKQLLADNPPSLADDEQLITAFEHASIGMSIVSIQGKFSRVNKALQQMVGYSEQEILNKTFQDLTHPEDLANSTQAQQELLVGTIKNFQNEKRYIHKLGHKIWVNVSVSLLRGKDGRPVHFITLIQDISEKKNNQELQLRSQRMESIGVLAGGIAHDINNVLAPIMLCVDLLKRGELDPGRIAKLDRIASCSQRGADMIKQLLSFSRGSEGQRRELNAESIILEIAKIVEDTFLKLVQIKISIDTNLLGFTGDATQLHQVLLNLCVNAKDAMPEGGILNLSARNYTLTKDDPVMSPLLPDGDYVVIGVEDTGIGISREILPKIFDPFFTTKEIGAGTGLGLSTSLSIIKSHGGIIQVYSELGNGTHFKIYLPAKKKLSDSLQEAICKMPPQGNGELILVVDDEPDLLQMTSQVLDSGGYNVCVASSGHDAIALYATLKNKISLVLVDVMMPVMTGDATIRGLRLINPEVVIIATSGLNGNSGIEQTKYFLSKPFSSQSLLEIIRQGLDEMSTDERD